RGGEDPEDEQVAEVVPEDADLAVGAAKVDEHLRLDELRHGFLGPDAGAVLLALLVGDAGDVLAVQGESAPAGLVPDEVPPLPRREPPAHPGLDRVVLSAR